MDEFEEQIDEQIGKDRQKNKPWLWKKGQSGNPAGRPPGKTMKEYTREYLAAMTEEERQDFLDGLPKEIVWKMAEGNPSNEITGKDGKDLIPEPSDKIKELADLLRAKLK